jgi:UV excision repair protein RAD23
MQVKVKTLDKKELIIDVEETDKVLVLKEKIQKERGDDPALEPKISKLIWKGKILLNDAIIKDAGISDKGFCVIMPGKIAKPAQTSSTSKPEEKKTESTPATPAAVPTTPAATAAPTPPVATAQPASAVSGEDPIMQLQAQLQLSDELISNIVAVSGMSAEKARLALTVSQGNPDLAVELIMSNNLEPAVAELRRRLQGGAPAAAQQSTESEESTGESNQTDESNPLHYLTQNPMGQQMIAAIRQNPGILPQILQQISQTNPELFQQLQNNHEAFLQLLENDSAAPVAGQQQQGGSGAGAGQQRVELQITQEDRAAIDRLMSISQKSEVEVVQAYMACDKNEEHALNLLFDS